MFDFCSLNRMKGVVCCTWDDITGEGIRIHPNGEQQKNIFSFLNSLAEIRCSNWKLDESSSTYDVAELETEVLAAIFLELEKGLPVDAQWATDRTVLSLDPKRTYFTLQYLHDDDLDQNQLPPIKVKISGMIIDTFKGKKRHQIQLTEYSGFPTISFKFSSQHVDALCYAFQRLDPVKTMDDDNFC